MLANKFIHRLNRRDLPLIPRLPRYIKFLLIIGIFITSTLLVKITRAQSTQNIFLQKQQAIFDGGNQESWLDEALGSNLMSTFIGLNGTVPQSFFDYFSSTGKIPKTNIGGALGQANKYIASTFTPPASGIEYIASLKDNILGKPAYAQGVGFKGLQFLLPLWRGFRNVVYVISSIIFVVIGLMIMLRVKVSPQAVITIQSSIPGIITTLILVTFSYAIAGLAIDIGNFLLAFVVAILFSIKGIGLDKSYFNFWSFGTGLPGLSDLGNLFNNVGGTFNFTGLSDPNLRVLQLLTFRALPGWVAFTMLGGLLGSIIFGFFLGGIGNWVLGGAGNSILDIVGRFLGGGIGGIVGALILPIIFAIVVGIWLIKLYFGLIKAYVTLIFKIVTGPLEISMGAFPNSKMGFSSWFRDVFANIAVFPIVTIFLILLNTIVDAIAGTNVGASITETVWAPSLVSAGGINSSILAAAVGMAGLAMLSKLPDMVPEFIFMIKPSPFGKAIGEGLNLQNTPIVGGVMRGVQNEAEKQTGETILGWGKETGTAAKGAASNLIGKIRGRP